MENKVFESPLPFFGRGDGSSKDNCHVIGSDDEFIEFTVNTEPCTMILVSFPDRDAMLEPSIGHITIKLDGDGLSDNVKNMVFRLNPNTSLKLNIGRVNSNDSPVKVIIGHDGSSGSRCYSRFYFAEYSANAKYRYMTWAKQAIYDMKCHTVSLA